MLSDIASERNASLILLTETHLNEEVRDAEIQIDGFDSYRTDRIGHKNGGVVVYVKTNLNLGASVKLSFSHNKVETLVVSLERVKTMLVLIYRPPDTDVATFLHVIDEVKRELADISWNWKTIVTGDFNFPFVDWNHEAFTGGTINQQIQADKLLEFSGEMFMEQHIRSPTRGDNILDLFFCNEGDFILEVKVEPTILSDHKLVYISNTLLCSTAQQGEKEGRHPLFSLNFYDRDIKWEKVKDAINEIRWEDIFAERDIDDTWNLFYSKITTVLEKFIPKKKTRRKSIIPKDRKVLMRNRAKLQKRLNSISPTETLKKVKYCKKS